VFYGLLSLFIGSFLLVTSIFWFPVAFVISLPFLLLAVGAFLIYSYVNTQITYIKLAVMAFFATFVLLNDALTLLFPKFFRTFHTAGYADSSDDGIFLREMKYHMEVFQMQLYNFVALMNPGIPSF
jgi:hypothetical protein